MANQITILLFLSSIFSYGSTQATTGPKTISQNGINLVETSEGYSATFYPDQVGVETIGYGHSCAAHDCSGIIAPITPQEGQTLLEGDLAEAVGYANNLLSQYPLTQNQFDAIVDFIFNMGVGTFQNSVIYADIQQGNLVGAGQAFILPQYTTQGGSAPIAGLVVRRQAEMNLFNS